MVKKIFFGFILSFFSIGGVNAEFYFPIQEMSKPECRFQDFGTLNSDCKQQLPILKSTDYEKYKNDYSVYRRIYTVLWGSTYDYGWDVGYGGHSGLDIATAKGTPVYAMTEGKVVYAGNLSGRGNTVKIEHTHNGRKIYSNYSHMSSISVSVGEKVSAKSKIGEVGNTGNSYGNHLHFQIDISLSGKGPRYRSNCSEKNYDNIVNSPICFDQLAINTVDPIRFLETNGAIVKEGGVIEKPKPEVINPETILSREEILKKEIEEFIKNYEIKVSVIGVGSNIELGKPGTFRITVTDKRTRKPYNGAFPGEMNFKYNKNAFDIFPTAILQIDNGKRDFKLTPKIEGKNTLEIYFGESYFKKVQFGVFNTKKGIVPKSAVLSVKKNSVIGENKKGILYFRDNYGVNILGFPFSGTFTLTSPSKNIKYCVKKAKTLAELQRQYNSKCREEFFTFDATVKSSDAYAGIVVFEYKVLNEGTNTLKLIDNSNYKELSTYKFNGTLPLGLSNTYVYYENVISISKKGIASGITSGYFQQEKELTTEDAVNMLKNYLEYKINGCSNQSCKSNYLSSLNNLSKEENSRFNTISRIDYIYLLNKYAFLEKYNGKIQDYRDLNEKENLTVTQVMKENVWQDYFGKTRYFQPNKIITRGEAAFLLDIIIP